MITISGFTFVHNAIDSGYPIVEAIMAVQPYVNDMFVVDMQSTDDTREVLEKLKAKSKLIQKSITILDGEWGNQAGETLRQAHSKYIECSGDVIVHFEADEVFDDRLIEKIRAKIKHGYHSLTVYRLQIEANFQRCRWYPEPVHRVFPRLSGSKKDGHTTDQHHGAYTLMPKNGYVWDITNCFRDNWTNRVIKQAELRDTEPQYIATPLHILHEAELTRVGAEKWLRDSDFWHWSTTPFDIPKVLKPLVGMTKYKARL